MIHHFISGRGPKELGRNARRGSISAGVRQCWGPRGAGPGVRTTQLPLSTNIFLERPVTTVGGKKMPLELALIPHPLFSTPAKPEADDDHLPTLFCLLPHDVSLKSGSPSLRCLFGMTPLTSGIVYWPLFPPSPPGSTFATTGCTSRCPFGTGGRVGRGDLPPLPPGSLGPGPTPP